MVHRKYHLDSVLGHYPLRIAQAGVVDQQMQRPSSSQELGRGVSDLPLRSEIGVKEVNVLVTGAHPNLSDYFISASLVPVDQEQLRTHPGQFHGGDSPDSIGGASY